MPSGPRPFGVGPYGTGPYSRWGPAILDVAAVSSIAFDAKAAAAHVWQIDGATQIAWNVVSRGITMIMHAEAPTQIAWDVQAEFWQSWVTPQPCEGGVWTPAVPCEAGGWAPPPACSIGQWQPYR